jgi:16S rRNA (cytidine1402-2'-O)-methyltransferase
VGTLYVVATPIGNLEDITLRALRVLREADLVAAEDTRHTRKLLSHYDVHTPLVAHHAHSGAVGAKAVLDHLRAGRSVALVTDSGTPGVSDPGADLVAAAIAAGIPVTPVPGPSAVIAALSVSGLLRGRFAFEGFPPRAPGEQRRFFASLRADPRVLVFYESPQRLGATIGRMRASLGDRQAVLGRELTKQFEELARGTLGEIGERLAAAPPRGECVIVIAGAPEESNRVGDPVALATRARELLADGLSERDAARQLAVEQGVSRRAAYDAALRATRD